MLTKKTTITTRMKNRYSKAIAGRVNPDIRNRLRPCIESFSAEHDLTFNTVFGAVMFAGERLKGRVTYARVEALVTLETMHAYEQELRRRMEARRAQITGLIRRALPAAKRTSDGIERVFNQLHNFHGSIPALKRQIAGAVAVE